ncbi:MAG: hypothetical protein GF341_06960 [candidate division Zixibacteria bacterium]|nr:hypothetical protein [candidate division Zixibacteria bacterium]
MRWRPIILVVLVSPLLVVPVGSSETIEPKQSEFWPLPSPSVFAIPYWTFEDLPIRGWREALELSPGLVVDRRMGEYHLRGGISSDLDLTINGISMRDEFTGRLHMEVPDPTIGRFQVGSGRQWRSLDSNPSTVAIETRKASYRDGTNVEIEGVTAELQNDGQEYDVLSAHLHGTTGRGPSVHYNVAAERQWRGGDHWSWQGIMGYDDASRFVTKFGINGVDRDDRWQPMAYYFNAEHAPRTTLSDLAIWNQSDYAIDPQTSIHLQLDWHRTERKTGDGLHFDNLWGYGRPDGQTRFDRSTLFWLWDDYQIDENGEQIVTPSYDTVLSVPISDDGSVRRDIAFVMNDEGHVWNDYQTYQWSAIGGEVQLHRTLNAKFASGLLLSYRRHTVRSYQHFFPVNIYRGSQGGFTDINAYGYDNPGNPADSDDPFTGVKHPSDAAAELRAAYERGQVRVIGRARLNHWDYDAYVFRNMNDPLNPEPGIGSPQRLDFEDLKEAESYTRISPMLSAVLEASQHTTLYVSASQTYRRPDFRDLYMSFTFAEYKLGVGGYEVQFANAELEPRVIKEYEAGLSQQLHRSIGVAVTGFYKDMFHLAGDERIPTMMGPYLTLKSNRSAIARGVEFRGLFEPTEASNWPISLSLLATHSIQQVRGNTFPSHRFRYGPLSYDLRHRFVGILNLRNTRTPSSGRISPFHRWAASLVFTAESGLPYTPYRPYNEVSLGDPLGVPSGPVNSESMPAYYRLGLKLGTDFRWQNRTLNLYLWVLNLFDRDNAIDVYSGTGEPDNTDWLETPEGREFAQDLNHPTDNSGLTGEEKFRLRENDPANFGISRQIRFGARLMF